MPILVKMPKWGLTMKTGTVTTWLRDEGANVSAGEPLLEVETDKLTSDVEAPADGVLRKIVGVVGAEIPVSDPVAVLTAPGETLTDEDLAAFLAAFRQEQQAGTEQAAGARVAREARAATRSEDGRVNASPAARKLARELDIDLAEVSATGPGGRITSDDVERAAAAQSEVREDYVTISGGLRLFYVLAGPARARPPLVFIHGLGGSQSTWQTILPGLAEQYRVCALDLPGHGQSDKPAPSAFDYSLAGLVRAVTEAMETLRLASAVFVGHSLGGAVAMQMALERPASVSKLVLIDSAGLSAEINAELFDRIEAEPSQMEARRLLELFFHDQRYVLESGIEDTYRQQTAPGAMEAVRAMANASLSREGQRTGIPPRLGELKPPVLIIWGHQDRVIPVTHAASGAQAIGGATVVVLDDTGHVPQVENAAGVVRAIEQFLAITPG